MDRVNWKDGAELIGVLAIVLSLIFVGLQIKQSHEIAYAAQYQARLDSWLGVTTAEIQSDIALGAVADRVRSWQPSDGIDQVKWKKWLDDTPVEVIGYHVLRSNILLKQMDNQHFQYQAGFLDRDAWLVFRLSLARQFSRDPIYLRATYVRTKDEYRPDFRTEVERIIAEIDGTSPPE